jgi:hypothetical protein
MSEVILTLRDVKIRLHELQKKYECSNEDFRTDPEVRSRVSADDEFEWEAFLAHADGLHEQEKELHREYLAHGVSAPREVTNKAQVAQLLAA